MIQSIATPSCVGAFTFNAAMFGTALIAIPYQEGSFYLYRPLLTQRERDFALAMASFLLTGHFILKVYFRVRRSSSVACMHVVR